MAIGRERPAGQVSIAVEGPPRVGKTTLVSRLAAGFSAGGLTVEVVPELVARSGRRDAAFFRYNDQLKAELLRASRARVVLLDRYWVSTVAYILASRGTGAVLRRPANLAPPTAWLYLDRSGPGAPPTSSDGMWPLQSFCDAHRRLSLLLLAGSSEPVWVAPSGCLDLEAQATGWVSALLGAEPALR